MSERLTVVDRVFGRFDNTTGRFEDQVITEGETARRIKKMLQESTERLVAGGLPIPPVRLTLEDDGETVTIKLKPEEAVLVVDKIQYHPLGTADRYVILKPDGKLYLLDLEAGFHYHTDGSENEVIWEPVWQEEIRTRNYPEFGLKAIREVEKLTESNRDGPRTS